MACREIGKRDTGKSEKPSDRYAVPLCGWHHRDGPEAQHRGGEAAFWTRVGIDPFALAARLYEEYTSDRPERTARPPRRRKATKRAKSRFKTKWPKRAFPPGPLARNANHFNPRLAVTVTGGAANLRLTT